MILCNFLTNLISPYPAHLQLTAPFLFSKILDHVRASRRTPRGAEYGADPNTCPHFFLSQTALLGLNHPFICDFPLTLTGGAEYCVRAHSHLAVARAGLYCNAQCAQIERQDWMGGGMKFDPVIEW